MQRFVWLGIVCFSVSACSKTAPSLSMAPTVTAAPPTTVRPSGEIDIGRDYYLQSLATREFANTCGSQTKVTSDAANWSGSGDVVHVHEEIDCQDSDLSASRHGTDREISQIGVSEEYRQQRPDGDVAAALYLTFSVRYRCYNDSLKATSSDAVSAFMNKPEPTPPVWYGPFSVHGGIPMLQHAGTWVMTDDLSSLNGKPLSSLPPTWTGWNIDYDQCIQYQS